MSADKSNGAVSGAASADSAPFNRAETDPINGTSVEPELAPLTRTLTPKPRGEKVSWANASRARCMGRMGIIGGGALFATGNGTLKFALETARDELTMFSAGWYLAVVTLCLNMGIIYSRRGGRGVRDALRGRADKSLPEHLFTDARAFSQGKARSDRETWRCFACYFNGLIFTGAIFSMQYVSIHLMDFGDTFTIWLGLETVLTIIMASSCLGEDLFLSTVTGALCTIGGILLISRPPFIFGTGHLEVSEETGTHDYMPPSLAGIGILVISGFCFASHTNLMRYLRMHGRSPQTVVHGMMSVMAVGSTVLLFVIKQPDGPALHLPGTYRGWFSLVFYQMLLMGGMIFVAYGYKFEHAGVGTILSNTEIVFAFMTDALLLDTKITHLSMLGAFFVFMGACIASCGGRQKLTCGTPPPDLETGSSKGELLLRQQKVPKGAQDKQP